MMEATEHYPAFLVPGRSCVLYCCLTKTFITYDPKPQLMAVGILRSTNEPEMNYSRLVQIKQTLKYDHILVQNKARYISAGLVDAPFKTFPEQIVCNFFRST